MVAKEYYEWLLDMRHYLHQKPDYNSEDLKSLPILFLESPAQGHSYYCLKVRIHFIYIIYIYKSLYGIFI